MKKKTALWLLLDLVFLVVFNTLFFVLGGTEHPVSVWISYAFIHVAYLLVLATPLLLRKSERTTVLGLPIFTVSAGYFVAEFVIGLFFVLVGSESYKTALVVQIVLGGIYAALLLSLLIANENTGEAEARREKEISYIKNGASRVKLLLDKLKDKKANRVLEQVYDLLHSSPSHSSEQVSGLEFEIMNKIAVLEENVRSGNQDRAVEIAQELIGMIEQRNSILSQNN